MIVIVLAGLVLCLIYGIKETMDKHKGNDDESD